MREALLDLEFLAELVEGIPAALRSKERPPREFILKAIERVMTEQEAVERYQTGYPSLGGTYGVAVRLHEEWLVATASFPREDEGDKDKTEGIPASMPLPPPEFREPPSAIPA